jgi:Ricin-type beta-trefoil lectin domain-like/Ricin-type beta-trefoil lectin domain
MSDLSVASRARNPLRRVHHFEGSFSAKIRRGIAALITCVTTSAMILVATPVPAAQADYYPIAIGPLVGGQYGYVKCLQPVNGSLNAGDAIVIETCNSSDAQQWSVLVSSNVPQFHLVNKASNLCMDARGNAVNGTPIQQWPCDTISNEIWSLGKNGNDLASGIYNSQVAADRKQWTHCIAATYPGDIDGLPAELQACDGDILQQWNNPVPSAFVLATDNPISLVNVGSGKCFAPNPPWAVAGFPVQQQTCDGFPVQQWVFLSAGTVQLNKGVPWYCPWCINTNQVDGYFIYNQNSGLCMDVQDGSTSDSSVVQQSTCSYPPSPQVRSMIWYIAPGDFFSTFKVRNLNSDHCLDVRDGSSADYAQLQQYHCTSNNAAQNFRQTSSPL